MVVKQGFIRKTSLIICTIFILASMFSTLIYAEEPSKVGVIVGDVVNLRAGASTDAEILGQYIYGDVVYVVNVSDNWAKVKYYDDYGYVYADYVDLRPDAVSRSITERANRAPDISKGQEIVNYAKRFLGTPYRYGGMSPSGFDCSGFVGYVYKQFGYSLNRTASGQASNGRHVDKAELMPGDIVCFYTSSSSSVTHVGIYVGDGMFIHSPSPGKTVCITSLYSSYYGSRYAGARRIV